MKKYAVMAAFVVVNFILQTSLYGYVNIFGVVPCLSLILVVVFAVLTDNVAGALLGALTGVLYDVIMYDVFGLYTLIFFTVGAVIGTFNEELNRENTWLYVLLVLAASVFMQVMTYLTLFFMRVNMNGLPLIMGKLILEIILNTILAAAIFRFVIYFFNKINIKLLSR